MPKNLKISLGIGVFVIAIGGALLYAQPKTGNHESNHAEKQAGSEILQVNEKTHDFGAVSMKNGKVTTSFKVSNPLSEPVELSKLYTSCMCTVAKLKLTGKSQGPFGMPGHGLVPSFKEVLQSNQEAEVEVTFDPNAHGPAGVGEIERTVTLEGKQGIMASMNIKANVTP